MSPYEPSEYGRIHYISPLAPIEFRLLDHQHQPIEIGFGEIDVKVRPGIYKMQMIAGTNHDEQFITIEPNGKHIVDDYRLDYPTTTPVRGSSTTHEFHSGTAYQYSINPMHDLGSGGRLMIYIRNVVINNHDLAKTIVNTTQLSIHDHSGKLLSDDQFPWHIDQQYGFAVWSASVAAGGYILRWRDSIGSKTTFDQALWVEKNWTTIVFLPYYPKRKSRRLERRGAVVQMFRQHDGFMGDHEPEVTRVSMATEVALNGLREGRVTLASSEMNLLLQAKFKNPMLGILGAYNLLLLRKPNWSLLETVIKNLGEMIPEHPDLAALIAATEQARGKNIQNKIVSPWPPTILCGYRALLALDAEIGTVIPANSITEHIAPVMLSNIWTTWKTLQPSGPKLIFAPEKAAKMVLPDKGEYDLPMLKKVSIDSTDDFGPFDISSWKSNAQGKEMQADPVTNQIKNALREAFKYEDSVLLKDLIHQVQLPSVSVKRALKHLGENLRNGAIVNK